MARKPRIESPGALYHVIARGNQRSRIFLDDEDYRDYLNRLCEKKSLSSVCRLNERQKDQNCLGENTKVLQPDPLILRILFLAVVICFISACGSSGGTTTTTTSGTAMKGLASCTTVTDEAVICGTVLAADGVTPIVGATITRGSASASSSLRGLYGDGQGGFLKGVASDTACQTDTSGAFACSGTDTTGTYTFYINSTIGDSSFSATATVDATTDVATSETTLTGSETTIKWLVVPGSYDGVQLLLSQLKDCTLTGDASDPEVMTTSDECEGVNLYVLESSAIADTFSDSSNLSTYDSIFVNCDADLSSYSTALQEYVTAGGNLYFSDLADDGLTAAFPGNVTFGSGATSTGTVTADVDHSGLSTYLGAATMSVIFDLPSWQDITVVESNVTTYISGDTSSLGGMAAAPITIGWKEGTGGCIFYTSYHIEGASSGADQEKALKYLVLNIDEVCE